MDEIASKLLEAAKPEVGYSEESSGLTKFGEWYYEKVDDGYKGFKTAPWCDMFIAWAADKAGVEEYVGSFAYTPTHAKWFQKYKAWGTKPEPGALVFFDWSGSNSVSGIDHVGIVEKVDGKKVHTIEANIDGGNLKTKVRDEGVIVGYGYPSKVAAAKGATAAKTAAEKKTASSAPAQQPAKPGIAAPAKPVQHTGTETKTTSMPPSAPASGILHHSSVLTGLLSLLLLLVLVMTWGKSRRWVLSLPVVRLRTRGRHHRGGFGLFDALEDDEDLAFWSAMHSAFAGSVTGKEKADSFFEDMRSELADETTVSEDTRELALH